MKSLNSIKKNLKSLSDSQLKAIKGGSDSNNDNDTNIIVDDIGSW